MGSCLFIFGLPVALVAFGLVSFVPAARGHWSTLLLAGPCALLGLILTALLFADGRPDTIIPALWVVFPLPFLVGGASIVLW